MALYKDMSDTELRTEYRSLRELAYNNARIAQQGRSSANRMAKGMGRLMKGINIIEAVAKRRKISLVEVAQ